MIRHFLKDRSHRSPWSPINGTPLLLPQEAIYALGVRPGGRASVWEIPGGSSWTEERTKHQIQSAIHWYGISITVDDPAVSYVAAWTGLSASGLPSTMSRTPTDPKLAARSCWNAVGKDRDRKMAGIHHMINRLIIDLFRTQCRKKPASGWKRICWEFIGA